jgi:hypothetical protein
MLKPKACASIARRVTKVRPKVKRCRRGSNDPTSDCLELTAFTNFGEVLVFSSPQQLRLHCDAPAQAFDLENVALQGRCESRPVQIERSYRFR